MDVNLQPGSYVVAVSGGVDSMTLLHILWQRPDIKVIVAHFDHGIRGDSLQDRLLVQATARRYSLPFVYDEGSLGAGASESSARQARYDFLRKVQAVSAGKAIITAHHQDDLLETAILNIIRGTGRKGLTALSSRSDIVRPLLDLPKQTLLNYALSEGLTWREDSTNQDQTYLRNYVRANILPRLDASARSELLRLINRTLAINQELDNLLINELHSQSIATTIDRGWFNHLPHSIAKEILAAWLRANGIRDFTSRNLERLVVSAKVARAGKSFALLNDCRLQVGSTYLALALPER